VMRFSQLFSSPTHLAARDHWSVPRDHQDHRYYILVRVHLSAVVGQFRSRVVVFSCEWFARCVNSCYRILTDRRGC